MAQEKSVQESILVVDDSPLTLRLIEKKLTDKKYRIYTASDVQQAIEILESTDIDLVITDMVMPSSDGLDLTRHVAENFKLTEIIVMTGYASVETAVEAVKTGAEEYLTKPIKDEELFAAVERALNITRRKKSFHVMQTDNFEGNYGIIGESNPMLNVLSSIEKAASTIATVLITGESGTGKELVARAIHYSSERASGPFVTVNCGAIPESLLESELFGSTKGAYTGASESREGYFKSADKGTIFLDEISNTSHSMQSKLLRVLQQKEFIRVGSNKPTQVDVKIVAATNINLYELVQKDKFREDLYYRINVLTIDMPPLSERGDDVYLLTNYFAEKYANEFSKPIPEFSQEVLRIFRSYPWSGNVRELENLIQRLVVMAEGKIIQVPDLPSHMRYSAPHPKVLKRTLEEVEVEHIRNVLESVGGNKTKAAEILGIDRKTLREKLKKFE